ncbi:hypothetical protein MIMGU_mgv1a0241702mg, partial [Erythranthe guttata]
FCFLRYSSTKSSYRWIKPQYLVQDHVNL